MCAQKLCEYFHIDTYCGRAKSILWTYSFWGWRMRTVIAAIGLAAVALLTGIAHATPLVVTDGVVALYPVDTFASFSGDGFSVGVGYPFPFFSPSGSVTVPIGTGCVPGLPCAGGIVNVQVDGAGSCNIFSFTCGAITLTVDPLAILPAPFTAPFTATGHLVIGQVVGPPPEPGTTFDLVGQGTVEHVSCGTASNSPVCSQSDPIFVYTFSAVPFSSVPEPPTLLLVMASIGALGALNRSGRRWSFKSQPEAVVVASAT
jgi:hypothetical protein